MVTLGMHTKASIYYRDRIFVWGLFTKLVFHILGWCSGHWVFCHRTVWLPKEGIHKILSFLSLFPYFFSLSPYFCSFPSSSFLDRFPGSQFLVFTFLFPVSIFPYCLSTFLFSLFIFALLSVSIPQSSFSFSPSPFFPKLASSLFSFHSILFAE